MNSENLNRVADAIEKHEIAWLGFNMSLYVDDCEVDLSGHNCGTTACIAGWAAALSERVASADALFEIERSWCDCRVKGREFLGLNYDEAAKLFTDGPQDVPFGDITPAQAVRVLRYAAKHGVIDWDAAQKEPAP